MWMAWGPELTFFCNDAYRRDTLGKKYPWALGRPAREVWAEIWPDIGPRIEAVLRTGEATWDEALLLFLERSGFAEETYHTFSYSPLADDDGRIAGMLCVVSEDTERVIGERRLATLRDLGAASRPRAPRPRCSRRGRRHARRPTARSLPFTLIYLYDEDGTPRLAAPTRDRAGAPAAAPRPWPAVERAILVDDSTGSGPADGRWDEPPLAALVLPLGAASASGFLVAGLNRYRAARRGLPRLHRASSPARSPPGSPARAPTRTERRRAEALPELDRGQDRVLHQRQPRAAHAADAAARPGRGRAHRRRRAAAARRSASASSASTATRSGC